MEVIYSIPYLKYTVSDQSTHMTTQTTTLGWGRRSDAQCPDGSCPRGACWIRRATRVVLAWRY